MTVLRSVWSSNSNAWTKSNTVYKIAHQINVSDILTFGSIANSLSCFRANLVVVF